ncbi:MAG: hypothetical protein ACQ9IQ_00005, partial [Nitrospirales bacterium]
ARFADPGGAQTRCAQTVRAFSPVSAARLGPTTRPGRLLKNRWANEMTKNPENVTLRVGELLHLWPYPIRIGILEDFDIQII